MPRTELWDLDGELKAVRGGTSPALAQDRENVRRWERLAPWPGSWDSVWTPRTARRNDRVAFRSGQPRRPWGAV